MIGAFLRILVNRIFASLVFSGVLLVVAHAMGPSDFGPLGASLGVALLLTAVGDFGLTSYVILNARGESSGTVRTATRLSAVGGSLAAVLVCIASVLMGLPILLAGLLAFGAALDKFADNWNGVLIGLGKNAHAGRMISGRRLLLLVAFGLALLREVPAGWAFAIAYAAAGLLIQIFRPGALALLPPSSGTSVNEILRQSSRLWMATVASQARELDASIVLAVSGAIGSGMFSASSRLVKPLSLISAALGNVLLAGAADHSWRSSRRIARALLLGSLGFALVVGALAPYVQQVPGWVLGSDFEAASLVFLVMALGAGPTAVSIPLGSLLQAGGLSRFVATNGILFAVFGLSATLVGALVGGAEAAAACGVAALSLKCVSLWLRIEKASR